MRTLMKNQDLLKRVTCFIAAFTLAFSLFGTPAYAAEAAEAPAATAETLSTAAETPAAPEVPAVPADTPAKPAAPAYSADTAADQVNAADAEDETTTNKVEETTTPSTTNEDTEEATEGANNNEGTEGTDDTENTEDPNAPGSEDPTDPIDPTDPTDPVNPPEEGFEEAPYTMQAAIDLNEATGEATLTVSITNPTDTVFDNIEFTTYIYVGGNDAQANFPYVINLGANETLTYTATLQLTQEQLAGSRISFSSSATYDNLQANAFAEKWVGPQVSIDGHATLLDPDGTPSSYEFAAPGDTVCYTITLNNTSDMTVTVTGMDLPEGVICNEPFEEVTLNGYGSKTYVAYYTVLPSDDPAGDDMGLVSAKVAFTVEGKQYSQTIEAFKVAKPIYGYTLVYYADSTDSEPLAKETTTGLYRPVAQPGLDVLNAHLPQGYNAKTDADVKAYTLAEDASENVFDIVYTQGTFGYIINYYFVDDDGTYIPCGGTSSSAPLGATITVGEGTEEGQLNYALPEGYEPLTDPLTLTITENESENVLDVVYTEKTPIPELGYTVNYYKDSAEDPNNYLGSESIEAQPVGTEVTLTPEFQNRFWLPGYERITENTYVTIQETESWNTYNVVYRRAMVDYTVNYYKDAATEENLVGSYTDQFTFGYTVYDIDLNAHLPEGYVEQEGRGSIYISGLAEDNVLDVIYAKRSDLPYTVNYYKDSVSQDNFLGSDAGTGTFEADIPYTAGRFLPAGYQATPTIQGATTIQANVQDSVMNVVYTQVADYGYTVNYYKDSVAEGNWLATERGTAAYQSAIPYTVGAHLPEGYTAEDAATSGSLFVSTDEANNVLNVVYAKEGNLPYRIDYYADSTDGELLGSVTGFGTFEDPIVYDEEAYLPQGYVATGKVTGPQIITANGAANVVSVVYSKGTFGYAVNYYKDSVSADNLLGTNVGEGTYLDPVDYDSSAYVPLGYVAPGVAQGATTIGYDAEANVLNVVYSPGRFAYTINYYTDSVAPENLIQSSVQDPRTFGTTVQISADQLNTARPNGYAALTEGVQVTITEDPARNVVNVVFQPEPAAPVTPETPDQPSTPTQPEDPTQPGEEPADQPGTTPAPTNPVAGAVAAAAAALNDAPAYAADQAAAGPADEGAADETTIEDNENPLASSPFSTESPAQQQNGFVMLFLGVLFAALAAILLLVRKRWINTNVPTLDGATLAAENVKTSKLALYSAILFAVALGSGVLWFIFRI